MTEPTFVTIEGEPSVDVEHPELHHYTTWGGLEGIYKSRCLYGTRYDCLNDWSEVKHFKDVLIKALAPKLREELIKARKTSQRVAIHLSKLGGANTQGYEHAKFAVERLYDSTFSTSDVKDGFSVPFITSFCSHKNDYAYERENGLLSQWRGYGGDEKFAIVFDTAGLLKLMVEEQQKWGYANIGLMDVVYNTENFDCATRFPQLLAATTKRHMRNLKGEEHSDDDVSELFYTFTTSASRFKHRGFEEEREVRFVSFLHRKEAIENFYTKHGYKIPDIKYKPTKMFNDKERIFLFEREEDHTLPINRIIIGPHKDQKTLAKKVRKLVGSKIKLVLSETPLV